MPNAISSGNYHDIQNPEHARMVHGLVEIYDQHIASALQHDRLVNHGSPEGRPARVAADSVRTFRENMDRMVGMGMINEETKSLLTSDVARVMQRRADAMEQSGLQGETVDTIIQVADRI